MECVMDHIVLNVTDEAKMVEFYAQVLELAPERLDAYRAGQVPFPSIRLNPNTVIDLFPQRLWAKSGPAGAGYANLNHFCIALDKNAWDALLQRLEAQGVAIEDGPVSRWGAHGTGTSIYFRDPEGNLIEARYYEGRDTAQPCLLGS